MALCFRWSFSLIVVSGALVACGGADSPFGGDGNTNAPGSSNGDSTAPATSMATSGGSAAYAPGFSASAGQASVPVAPDAAQLGGLPMVAAAGGAGSAPAPTDAIANTNVSLGGSQDLGYFRALLEAGQVPQPGDLDAAGFFAEHHTALPPPSCGNRVCLQAMLGVMGNLMNGANCTMLQLGLNSPIAADPGARPPLTLSVVVDVSGSMNEAGKIDFVKQGLGQLIDGLVDGDQLSLVTYDSGVDVVFPMTEIVGNRATVRDIVDGLAAAGGTNIYDGLRTGYEEIVANYDGGRQNRVILLSDGNPTAGITGTSSILGMSEEYNSGGVGLTTIGLGTDFNVELMRGLALQADGNYYFLENAGAVSEVFREELSFFTVPIAFDLSLSLHAGSDYTFGRAYGSPLWEDTEDGGALQVPSVFIAHRESADDVTVDGGRRGGGSALLVELMPRLLSDDGSGQADAEVAVVDVSFREPGSDELVTDTVVVNYPAAPWETPEEGYFDSTDVTVVQKSFVMLNIYVGLENAVASFHEDRASGLMAADAVAGLDRLAAAVMDYNEEIQDTDIEYDLELIADLRAVMVQNGVQPEPDPFIPDNPWPAD